MSTSRVVLPGEAQGDIIATSEPLSFWGGVDPSTGDVIDVHHPLRGRTLSGKILFMPTSRGSCTGSGVLLDLILSGKGPAAIVFSDAEDVLTLGALIAAEMFARPIPVIRLEPDVFARLSEARTCRVTERLLVTDKGNAALLPPATSELELSGADQAMLDGRDGEAVRQAMKIIVAMAAQQNARSLVDVSQAHIDGCIYASPANLTFAEKMAAMGAMVRVPSTMNAISVDMANWRTQGTPPSLGEPAARLALAYVRMGCSPTYTCSPYLLSTAPSNGETIAWAESNAVIFANTVIGARTAKHPDFLDLCIALTGRAPRTGVYLDEHRRPRRILQVEAPDSVGDAFWPLMGYLAGKLAPDRIPVLHGLDALAPSRDDLKALCAAFGTTSAAPMLHIAGITPEASLAPVMECDTVIITRQDLAEAWRSLNEGPEEVQLIAVGSPHASADECRIFADEVETALAGSVRRGDVAVIVTAGQQVIDEIAGNGVLQRLAEARVQVLPDICWCSISEPVFPTQTRAVLTNSGKYAHYGPGLSNRPVRLGSLRDCAEAAVSGRLAPRLPYWLG